MKTPKEIVLEKFGEDMSGYIYAVPSDLEKFYIDTWNEAIDAAAENATVIGKYNPIDYSSGAKVNKQSILKLKK